MLWMRWMARGLSLVWAGFWVFFGVASGIGERGKPMEVLIHTAVPGLIFLVSALIAWRWEAVGGVLLVVEGLVVAVGYPLMARHFPLSTKIFIELTMATPPLVSGLLLLSAWKKS
jgi:hypothetical protein